MRTAVSTQHAASPVPTLTATPGVLQRACKCGSASGVSSQCPQCDSDERLGRMPVQAKLTISTPDDPFEREADRIAEQIMRMPEQAPQPSAVSPHIQRQEISGNERDEEQHIEGELLLQREAASSAPSPSVTVSAPALGAGSGMPLSSQARAFFEPRFGRDLGHVRVHSGPSADSMARSINARAFTHGADIYFAAGQYDPWSPGGRRLLAHEITHVFQQVSGQALRRKAADMLPSSEPMVRLPMDSPANPNEVAADRAAAAQGGAGASSGADAPPAIDGAAPSDGTAHLPAGLASAIMRPDAGTPLPASLREENEAHLGTSLAHVRVHQGSKSEALADALAARAFTYGADIWLGRGESFNDRRLMAHELAHVAQQSPRPAAAQNRSNRSQASRLQAKKKWYYALPQLGKGSKGPGERAHELILPLIGGHPQNTTLFTEAPIPQGAKTGADGRADMLLSSTGAMFGVRFFGEQPAFLPLLSKTMLHGKEITAASHYNSAAPAANAQTAGRRACKNTGLPNEQGICKVDQGPTVKIADLKPKHEAEVILADDQIKRYVTKVQELGQKVNNFGAKYPNLIHPTGSTWNPQPQLTSVGDIKIPNELEKPTSTKNRQVDAHLFIDGFDTNIRDRTVVLVEDNGDGVLTYEFIPVQKMGIPMAGAAGTPRPGGTISSAATQLNNVKQKLKTEPTAEAKRIASLRRRGSAAPRLALRREQLEAKDSFNYAEWRKASYSPWQATAKSATGGEGREALKKPSSEAEERMRDEALRQIRERVTSVSIQAPPPDTAARTRELEVVQHWIDYGERYGRLRQMFGTVYVKVVNTYDKVKARIEAKVEAAKQRMRRANMGTSSIKGAVLTAIRSIAGSLLGVFIRDVGGRLIAAVKKGATVLLGNLFGEETAAIEQQLATIREAERSYRAAIEQAFESKFKAQLETFEAKIRQIESIAATMRSIGDLVNTVKWAYRIAQCAAPPALGCLLGLVGSAIAETILASIVASCWFRREIAYPLVRALGPVQALPGLVAKAIADRLRDLLPEKLKPLIADVDEKGMESKAEDIECDSDNADLFNNLDENQRSLLELLKQYDPDHVDALLKALEHLGLIKNPPDPDDKVQAEDIAALKALLDTYSRSQLEDLVANTPAQPFRNGAAKDIPAEVAEAIAQRAAGNPQGSLAAGAAPQSGTSSVPSIPTPTAEEVVEEGAEIAKRLRRTKLNPRKGGVRFYISYSKGMPRHSDGTPIKAGDVIKLFFVAKNANGALLGAFHTLTIKEVSEAWMLAYFHAGARYYNRDGTYVDTNTGHGESKLTFDLPGGKK